MPATKTSDGAPKQIFEDYVEICNRVMSENMDRFWYRQAKRLNRTVWSDANFHTIVYDEHPDRVVGEYTLHFDPDAWELQILPPGDHEVAFSWKVPLEYLDDVVNERPEWYLEHPVMLDGVWMADRIRDEMRGRTGSVVALAAGLAVGVVAGALSAHLIGRCTRG